MAQNPKLSIGLPVYNGENFLASSIESLLAQTYTDFELIICDNASTDGTREICEKYASDDARVKYFPNEQNLGAAPNHNRTYELSTGEYFKWAAHDDELHPEFLSRCMDQIEHSPDSVVLVYTDSELIDAEGQVSGYYDVSVASCDPRPHRRLSRVIQQIGICTPMYGVARKVALQKTRMHGSYLSADYVFIAELALVGEIQKIDQPLFRKRMHDDRYAAATHTTSERLSWFDSRSSKSRNFVHREHRMLWECFRGVRLQRLGFRETSLCGFAILGWIVRKERVRLGRWKRSLLTFLRLRDSRA